MKKSTLAIGLIVALGAVWTGGAFYTGKVAENEFKRQIEYANQEYERQVRHSGIDIRLGNLSIERGLFSSNYTYDVVIKTEKNNFVIPTEGKLYHGPLPLNQLSKFNLAPAMFSATGQLVKNENTQTIFDSTNGKNPLVSEMTMSYSQRMKGVINLVQGELKQTDLDLAWSDATIQFDVDKEGYGKYDTLMPKLNILLKGDILDQIIDDDELEAMGIELGDVKATSDFQKTSLKHIVIGDVKAELGNLKYTYHFADKSQDIFNFAFNQIAVDFNAKQEQDFLNYGAKLNFGKILLNDNDLGKLALNAQFNHLTAKTVNTILETNPENESEMQRLGLELLQNQPHLQIFELSLSNSGGKMSAETNIELGNVDLSDIMSAKLLSMFKQLSFNAVVDQSALVQMDSIMLQVEDGLSKEEADVAAKDDVEYAVQGWLEQGIFVKNGESLKLTLNLENDGLNFNGNHIPEDSLIMLIFGLMINGF